MAGTQRRNRFMRTPRWKIITYALVIIIGLLPVIPNLLTPTQLAALPEWVSDYRITLGLDLQGGMHFVLDIDADSLVEERLLNLAKEAKDALTGAELTGARVRVANGAILVALSDPSDRPDALRAVRGLENTIGGGTFGPAAAELNIAADGTGGLRISMTEEGRFDRISAAVKQSIEILRLRIDEIGVVEPTVQRIGPDRILVQLPGVHDTKRIKELLGSSAKMSFHRVLPPGGTERDKSSTMTVPARDGSISYTLERRSTLSGDRLVDAAAGFDPQTQEPVVTFRFDSYGARVFGKFSQRHVGQPFAIVLDGKVLSAPVIQEPILGGSGQISGRFTVQEAGDTAALLRAGALPAPLIVSEERTVGAEVGHKAVVLGAWSALIGFALVFAFMAALYGGWGLIANTALLLNVLLTFSALSWLGATLTLPGIAGIVLSIGLAVDANVLINERIREETRKGRTALAALNAGFKRAYATIVDANITTLIATTLLFMFGSGPVRGFAVTMGIGILISMFTAVSVVRVTMERLLVSFKPKQLLFRSPLRILPDRTNIRFMRARFFGIALSVVLSLASLALFAKPGLNYGIDFAGGIQIEITTPKPADLIALRTGLVTLDKGEVTLQSVDDGQSVLVRVEKQPGEDDLQANTVEEIKSAIGKAAPGAEFARVEQVGPKVSGELVAAGITAVALAGTAMLVYIWTRFDWPFAVGAIATLALDTTKTIGFFALTGLEFNLAAIAALLTLIGYSVNDKVVVYDRMRENMRLFKKMNLRDVIDRSINETLGRSLYTSATTFLAMLPMAIAGGTAVQSFAVPMLFGVIIATGSSIFIAAPILLVLGDWRQRRRKALEIADETLDREEPAQK